MKFAPLFLISLMLCNCQNIYYTENPFTHYAREKDFFTNLASDNRDSKQSVILTNFDYPIDITLYKDNTFTYKLDVLGKGEGTWKHSNGFVSLYAERKRFVMKMQLHNIDPSTEAISLVFADRFGQNFLPMTVIRKTL